MVKRASIKARATSGHSKRLKAEATLGAEAEETGEVHKLQENTQGLAILPDELYLEVISYFPVPSLLLAANAKFDTDLHTARREALLALSQTCRNMRRFCHPYIWKRIEVFTGMRVGSEDLCGGTKAEDRKLALELVRQLEVVTIRDPTLAQYVDTVNVDIRNHSAFSVLQELARCMALFVNLRTVRLRIWTGAIKEFKVAAAFQPYTYYQIRSVIISSETRSLLRHCPQLRSLKCLDLEIQTPRLMLDSTVGYCPLLEKFPPIAFDDDLQELAKNFPHLRELSLILSYYCPGPDANLVDIISNMTRLQTMTFHLPISAIDSELIDDVELGHQFLLNLQKDDKEEKYLWMNVTDPLNESHSRLFMIKMEVPQSPMTQGTQAVHVCV